MRAGNGRDGWFVALALRHARLWGGERELGKATPCVAWCQACSTLAGVTPDLLCTNPAPCCAPPEPDPLGRDLGRYKAPCLRRASWTASADQCSWIMITVLVGPSFRRGAEALAPAHGRCCSCTPCCLTLAPTHLFRVTLWCWSAWCSTARPKSTSCPGICYLLLNVCGSCLWSEAACRLRKG